MDTVSPTHQHSDGTGQYPEEVTRNWRRRGYHNNLWRRARRRVIRTLPRGARLLEIGFGSAFDTVRFARHFTVTGIDASLDMVKLAQHDYPDLDLREGSVFDLSAFSDDEFQVVVSMATWLHFEKKDYPRLLAGVRRILADGGQLVLSLKRGQGEGWFTEYDDDGTRFDRYFCFWEVAELRPILEAEGFFIEFVDDEMPDPVRTDVTWIELHLRLRK